MGNIFSIQAGQRWLKPAVLALGLAGGATSAQAQAPSIYALGIFTAAGLGQAAGTQVLSVVTPASPTITAVTPIVDANGVLLTQQLVGLDIRPNTGQLYALGYTNSAATNNAQVYILNLTTASSGALATVTAVPVGGPITLDLGLSNRTDLNSYNLVVGVGFDFNPRADRIRVTGLNRANYRLNPNTGAVAATDATLTYADAGNLVTRPTLPLNPPQIGAVAYTNSTLGQTTTQLYDIDQTPTEGLVATQSIVSGPAPITTGTLTAQARLLLNGPTDNAMADIRSANFDLDIYTDAISGQNTAYLFELTRPTTGSNGSSNLYTLNLQSGIATRLGNLIGGTTLRYTNIAASLSPAPYVWTGALSTDWNTAGNWSTNMVPNAGIDVFIPGLGPTVPNQPTVSSGGPAKEARSIVLGAGTTGQASTLTLASGATLNIYGNFANNEGSVAGAGTLALTGPAAATQDVGGTSPTIFPNLSVGTNGATATTSSAVSIRQALLVSANLAIGSDQPFTLLSSSAGTAYVVNNNGAAVTGTATVQRYITPTNNGPGYRHYSSPVSGNTVADFATAGFTPVVNPAYNSSNTPRQVSPYPTVFYYDQSRLASSNASYAVGNFDNGFLSPSSLGDGLAVGRGYTVNIGGSELVDFQGTLNQASSYARTGLTRGAQTSAGYQLLGNPYPGALNYDALIASSVGMESALYVYKSTGQYVGTYTTYVPGGPTNGGPGVSANGGTSNIPLGQGFFMRTAAGQTGSVTFAATARTNAPETAKFERNAADPRPSLALTLRNASIANQMRVYFDQDATAAFDAKYDAHYLPATHGLDLASDLSTEGLAINGLPELTGPVTVPLLVHAPAAGTYTLAVDELNNLPAGFHAYLRDASAGTYTDLNTTSSISLTLTPTDPATGRYAVVFSATAPLATASATLSALAAVYPSPAHGTATLVLPQALRGTSASTVQLLNSLGQVVLTRTMAAGAAPSLELPLTNLAAGIYTVRATTEAGLVAKRLVVQ